MFGKKARRERDIEESVETGKSSSLPNNKIMLNSCSFDWQKSLRALSVVFSTSIMETGILAGQHKTSSQRARSKSCYSPSRGIAILTSQRHWSATSGPYACRACNLVSATSQKARPSRAHNYTVLSRRQRELMIHHRSAGRERVRMTLFLSSSMP